jgi:hypothetical protein
MVKKAPAGCSVPSFFFKPIKNNKNIGSMPARLHIASVEQGPQAVLCLGPDSYREWISIGFEEAGKAIRLQVLQFLRGSCSHRILKKPLSKILFVLMTIIVACNSSNKTREKDSRQYWSM